MYSIKRAAWLALGLVLVAPAVAAADTYTLANFSGAINPGNANVKAPFSGNGFVQSQTFSGSFVYDNDLIPASGSGFVNVTDSDFPDYAQIPKATLFTLNFGPLIFTAADVSPADQPFGMQIQYNNGAFNGFVFYSNFDFQGSPFQLQMQGGVITVVPVVNGFPTFQSKINAHINIGNGNVTNQTPYTPPPPGDGGGGRGGVPEPATWALMIAGFGGVGAMLRRRRTQAAAA